MSYLNERYKALETREHQLIKQLRELPSKYAGRPKQEVARIKKAIERDVAYVQRDQQAVAEASRG